MDDENRIVRQCEKCGKGIAAKDNLTDVHAFYFLCPTCRYPWQCKYFGGNYNREEFDKWMGWN